MPLDRAEPRKRKKDDLITVNRAYFESLVVLERVVKDHLDVKDLLFPKERLIRAALNDAEDARKNKV